MYGMIDSFICDDPRSFSNKCVQWFFEIRE